MNKVKDIFLKIAKVKYKKYMLVLVLGAIVVGFLGDNSVLAHRRNTKRIMELKREKARYLAEYQETQLRIYSLQTDVKELERVGRERHFMKMPDEDIFVLSDDTVKQKSASEHETVE